MGVHYSPENGNPLIRCPYGKKDCEHSPAGLKFPWCPCQLSQEPYDYDSSVEKLRDEQSRKEHEQWMEITGGQYCACVVGSNGYQGGQLQVRYDVNQCINVDCKNKFCSIRKKPRDLTRVNIFYDIRRTHITKLGFLEETKVELEKGVKVFPHPVARTDAEIWLKTKQAEYDPILSKHIIDPKFTSLDRQQQHFSKYHRTWPGYDYFEFHYDVENIRIEARETRDLLQDLRDVAEGIEVVHQADLLKAAKEQKQARREAAKAQRTRKIEQMILAHGWDGLEDIWKNRARKLLEDIQICELDRQHNSAGDPEPSEDGQINLWGD